MPSLTATPAGLRWVGGDVVLTPLRSGHDPAVLRWSGGTIELVSSAEVSTGGLALNLKLDRLNRAVAIVDDKGLPSFQFQALWQRVMDAVEKGYGNLAVAVTAIQAALDAAAVAQQAAADANAATTQAQAVTTLRDSYTDPIDVLSASSAGVVTIAAHNRVYGDGRTVAVNGGSVSGYAPGETVRPYYEDAAMAGGAVTYQATTGVISQGGSTHTLGAVAIPAAGQPPLVGQGVTPPGYVRYEPMFLPSVF